jgi:localization factor PodJL
MVTPPPMPPKTAAPPAGTDPIVTGSIPPRPAVQPKPREMSLSNLRNQARAGDAWAQFALATEYSDARFMSRDLNTAAQWYEKAAAQGLAPAQYRLASFYEKGLGVTRDIAKAQALYQKAAAAGNVRAMHNLAVLAADGGDSGRPDYATAARWFKRAAEFGVRDSQYNYAVLLARGMGVPQDFVSSYVWFAVAARQGDQDSATKRDDVSARLSADQLAAAKAMAEGFHPRTPSASANEVTMPVITTNAPTTPAPALSFGQRPKVSML